MLKVTIATPLVIIALSTPSANASDTIFSARDDGNTKILKLIRWIAQADDLATATTALPKVLGISQRPNTIYADVNGRHIKDWTDYLYSPIWPGAQSKLLYTVPEPGAPADSWRADVRLYLDPNKKEVCIHKADLISLFGQPTGTEVLTGGAGIAFAWVLRPSPYEMLITGYFGYAQTDCDPNLTIIEYPESRRKRQEEHYEW